MLDECPLPVHGGRAEPPAPIEVIQIFGQWASFGGVINPTVEHDSPWEQRKAPKGGQARLFQITLNATEVTRIAETALPLTRHQIEGAPGAVLPAGAVRTEQSKIKGRLMLSTAAGLEVYLIDSNQTIELWAYAVTISWAGAANMIVVNGFDAVNELATHNNVPIASQDGHVIDVLLGATIQVIDESVSKHSATLTEHLAVPANTTGVIRRPRGSREVTIYQTTAGAASVNWRQFGTDPAAGGLEIGSLPWIGGGIRRTQQESILPDTAFLASDVDALNDRLYTLAWTIRP